MAMGLLDLPAPALDNADRLLAAALPPVARLAAWALIGAIVSMALYRWLSPQESIARLKREAAAARRELDAFDGELGAALPLMRRMVRTSLRHVGIVLGPTLLASLPLLLLLVWVSTAYGYAMPGAIHAVPIHVTPPEMDARWVGSARVVPRIRVMDAHGVAVGEQTLTAPVTTLHKRRWWNALIGNPAGYLPREAPYERLEIGLARREYLGFGPAWLRSWEVPFFLVLVAGSLAIKMVFRVQ